MRYIEGTATSRAKTQKLGRSHAAINRRLVCISVHIGSCRSDSAETRSDKAKLARGLSRRRVGNTCCSP